MTLPINRFVVELTRRGKILYVRKMVLPPYMCKLTDNIEEAYHFHDKEWLAEKLRYYGVADRYNIRRI